MKFVTLCLALVVAAFGAVGLAAQGKPNLSGTWIAVGPQQHTRELTIKHDASTLTIEGQPDVPKQSFNLDGSETKLNAPDGKPLVWRAVWEGTKLVVTVHFPEIQKDIRRVTWAIDADGQLVTETAFLEGKPQAPIKEVFKRR